MLVFTPFAYCFVTSCHFYAFSGTNLLTSCHGASSLFSAVFVFQSDTQEIFSELDETKARSLIFPGSIQTSEERKKRGHRPPSHRAGVAQALATPPLCEEALAAL
jgi:hypothetical protein